MSETYTKNMQTIYRGHEIVTDHTGNYLTIDGIDCVAQWHKTNTEDPIEFAKSLIDSK